MFDRMNLFLAGNKPCMQPSGEHDTDDIVGENSNFQSFAVQEGDCSSQGKDTEIS